MEVTDKIKFEQGTLKVDINKDRELAIILAFSSNDPSGKGNIYRSVEKSLPKINGLKRGYKRVNFAFDLVNDMRRKGLIISFK